MTGRPTSRALVSLIFARGASSRETDRFLSLPFLDGSVSHPISTCAMMSQDLGGVVGEDLKVYGTLNVRVVDASVLPMQARLISLFRPLSASS